MGQPNQSHLQNLAALMEFDLFSLAGTLDSSQKEVLEKNLLESSFKKLIASEKLSGPDLETLETKMGMKDLKSVRNLLGDKIPNMKVKFLAHLATIKEDYIWILLHLMKLRQDPKYSPAMLEAANKRDWPTLSQLCQT